MMFSRHFRRSAAFAAAAAIALQTLWPLLAQARPADPTLQVPLCSVDGVTHSVEIKIGKTTPLDERTASHGEHCKLCVLGTDQNSIASVATLITPRESQNARKASTPVPRAASASSRPSRAPRKPPEHRAPAAGRSRFLSGEKMRLLTRLRPPRCAVSGQAFASCGSAFCSVNTSWDLLGGRAEPGALLDLRYENIKQDQPRNGSDKVSVGQIPRHHDEVFTKNSNWLGTCDYAFNADWGINVSAPIVDATCTSITTWDSSYRSAGISAPWAMRAYWDATGCRRRNRRNRMKLAPPASPSASSCRPAALMCATPTASLLSARCSQTPARRTRCLAPTCSAPCP
jgi:hypothetical protein